MNTMMTKALVKLQALRSNTDGATAIEYGLIAALVAIVLITALSLLGTNLSANFDQVATAL